MAQISVNNPEVSITLQGDTLMVHHTNGQSAVAGDVEVYATAIEISWILPNGGRVVPDPITDEVTLRAEMQEIMDNWVGALVYRDEEVARARQLAEAIESLR